MTTTTINLLAAASAAQAAALDLIEAARDGSVSCTGNIGAGKTTIALADSLRLLLDVAEDETVEDVSQLMAALARFLEGRIT